MRLRRRRRPHTPNLSKGSDKYSVGGVFGSGVSSVMHQLEHGNDVRRVTGRRDPAWHGIEVGLVLKYGWTSMEASRTRGGGSERKITLGYDKTNAVRRRATTLRTVQKSKISDAIVAHLVTVAKGKSVAI